MSKKIIKQQEAEMKKEGTRLGMIIKDKIIPLLEETKVCDLRKVLAPIQQYFDIVVGEIENELDAKKIIPGVEKYLLDSDKKLQMEILNTLKNEKCKGARTILGELLGVISSYRDYKTKDWKVKDLDVMRIEEKK